MDTTLVLFPARVAEIAPSDIHLNYFRSVADEKKAMLRIERSRFFPELSVGYVRQKIAPLSGLDSWMVGISFPVLFFPQHSRVRQAKIDSYIARTEAESNIRQLNNKVEELSFAIAIGTNPREATRPVKNTGRSRCGHPFARIRFVVI